MIKQNLYFLQKPQLMKYTMLLLAFFLLSTLEVSAQRKVKESLSGSEYHHWSIGIGYLSNSFINPGAMISAEKPFKTWRVTKKRKDKERVRHRVLLLSGHVGSYHHNNNHVGLITSARIGYRMIRPKGLKFEYALGLGYFHQFLDGQTYEVGIDNQVIEQGSTGQGGIAPSVTVGIGSDNWFHKKKRISWYFKTGYFFQIPYNNVFILRTPLEFGVSYRLI